MNDKYFMETALKLAKKGRGFTSPNPMVGAVIVKDGKIVGKGYHKAVGEAHAEVNALDDAGIFAKDSTLYVTLEPCNHTGRTPPCTGKIIGAGIKRVVVAASDPNPDVRGGGIDYLKKSGINITTGVCEAEAKKVNEVFEKYITTKRPFVTLKCASTLDGRIATRTGDSRWVSGSESRKFVHRLRHASDAVMVGIDTVKKDDPSLTTRIDINGKKGVDPVRIILDSHLSISENAKVLQHDSISDTIIITDTDVSRESKAEIENKGARIFESPSKDGMIDLYMLMERFGAEGITSLLIEGGSRVNASALASGIVDKVLFFYAPKILGGNDGVPVCTGPGPDLMSGCILAKDINIHRFGDDIMIEGYIKVE